MEGYSAEGCRLGFWELRAWLRHIGWCGRTKPSRKTIVNLAACDNDFEERFARFLQNAADVTAFAKLPLQFGFAIEYTDSAASLRYYEPDFVIVLSDESHRLVETKGREDPDVAHKDRAARLWCENATQLTSQRWSYLKVPQVGFDKLQPTSFADLAVFAAGKVGAVADAAGYVGASRPVP